MEKSIAELKEIGLDGLNLLFRSIPLLWSRSSPLRCLGLLHTDDGVFVCGLCLEPSPAELKFSVKGCAHFYCSPCIVEFVVYMLRDNAFAALHCPASFMNCRGTLDPDHCRLILPTDIFDSWRNALCDKTFTCDICVEERHMGDSFSIKDCNHFYCRKCIVDYVVSKLDDNVTYIPCPEPGCRGVLELHYCKQILPMAVSDRWGKALCENLILGSESNDKYYYCPFYNCSALLLIDNEYNVSLSKCPICKRLCCFKCKVPWHTDFDCDEYQKMRPKGEDHMLRKFSKKKMWSKCPNCKHYIEKTHECNHMKCRCGYSFWLHLSSSGF